MINVNDFKPGVTFKMDNNVFMVLESQHSKSARGQAHVKTKIKNLRTGSSVMHTFTGGDKVEEAYIEKRKVQFLYQEKSNFVFMSQDDYSQIEINQSSLQWEKNFLKEQLNLELRIYKEDNKHEEILGVVLPDKVTLRVIETTDAVKGNTASNPTKEAKLETGFVLQVPMFIKENEEIVVSTIDGNYSSRA